MPNVEWLSTPSLVAAVALAATVLALWLQPWWAWIAALGVTIVAGYVAGVLHGPAGLLVAVLAACVSQYRSGRSATARGLAGAGVVLLSLGLALHLAPGFDNPVVIRDAVLSAGALPYTQYVNFDKTLAGVVLLGGGALAPIRSVRECGRALRQTAPIVAATIAAVLVLSLAFGSVRFEPRWTPVFWAWAPINLLLTCVSEEAFFRAFLQREVARGLAGRRHGVAVAVGISAILFGLAHAGGGWRYVVLASLAGTGYALAFQRTGRLEMAILTHFAVNATHFLLFTYPALA